MKIATLCTMMALSVMTVTAQDNRLVERLSVEARGDYQRDYVDGETRQDNSGFKGKYFNLLLDGHITDHLSFSLRQRFNRLPEGEAFFKATDWFFVNYNPTERWTLSAGKQVIDIGGWEYDYAPINLYFCSEFWNQTFCYAWGTSVAYNVTPADMLRFQICESPYRQFEQLKNRDLYAYNLIWFGQHGPWSTKWSANMIEWEKGHFINYLYFGNELRFCREVSLEFDYLNRAVGGQTFFFKDCSVIGQINWQPSSRVKVFAKASYDVNKTDSPADLTVCPGTEITRVGAGVEYFPLGDDRVRLHANGCYSFGTNSNPDAVMLDKQTLVSVGLTWRLHVINEKK